MNKKEYKNYGTFIVTTEGDCEGRSTINLGVYTGYVDEIAFALTDKCYYTLHFKLVNPNELDLTPKGDTVKIRFDLDSPAWDMSTNTYNSFGDSEALDYFKSFFSDRDVEVKSADGYGGCTITTGRETIKQKRERILCKLSEEEKRILGII